MGRDRHQELAVKLVQGPCPPTTWHISDCSRSDHGQSHVISMRHCHLPGKAQQGSASMAGSQLAVQLQHHFIQSAEHIGHSASQGTENALHPSNTSLQPASPSTAASNQGPCTSQTLAAVPGMKSPQSDVTDCPRLQRMLSALDAVPSLVTICTLDGKVLYQNSASLAVMGSSHESTWQAHSMEASIHDSNYQLAPTSSSASEMLECGGFWAQLLQLQPELMEEMANSITAGRVWSKVVRIASASRPLSPAWPAPAAAHSSPAHPPGLDAWPGSPKAQQPPAHDHASCGMDVTWPTLPAASTGPLDPAVPSGPTVEQVQGSTATANNRNPGLASGQPGSFPMAAALLPTQLPGLLVARRSAQPLLLPTRSTIATAVVSSTARGSCDSPPVSRPAGHRSALLLGPRCQGSMDGWSHRPPSLPSTPSWLSQALSYTMPRDTTTTSSTALAGDDYPNHLARCDCPAIPAVDWSSDPWEPSATAAAASAPAVSAETAGHTTSPTKTAAAAGHSTSRSNLGRCPLPRSPSWQAALLPPSQLLPPTSSLQPSAPASTSQLPALGSTSRGQSSCHTALHPSTAGEGSCPTAHTHLPRLPPASPQWRSPTPRFMSLMDLSVNPDILGLQASQTTSPPAFLLHQDKAQRGPSPSPSTRPVRPPCPPTSGLRHQLLALMGHAEQVSSSSTTRIASFAASMDPSCQHGACSAPQLMSAGGPELGQRPAAGAGAGAQCVDQAAPGPQPPCLHEVCVTPFMDPETGSMLYIVQQQDVSARSELEQRLVALSEGQLALLHAMFPRHILERFALICCNSQGQSVALPSALPDLSSLATHHECVTIMFMDVVGFTTMSKDCSPEQVMGLLNELFSKLDDMLDRHGVMRVDTAGDCYIVCGGLLNEDEDGFMTVAKGPPRPAAKTRAARRVLNFTWEMMQAGRVQVSDATLQLLGDKAERWEPTGGVQVKGKGTMLTYLLHEDAPAPPRTPSPPSLGPQPPQAPPPAAAGGQPRPPSASQLPPLPRLLETLTDRDSSSHTSILAGSESSLHWALASFAVCGRGGQGPDRGEEVLQGLSEGQEQGHTSLSHNGAGLSGQATGVWGRSEQTPNAQALGGGPAARSHPRQQPSVTLLLQPDAVEHTGWASSSELSKPPGVLPVLSSEIMTDPPPSPPPPSPSTPSHPLEAAQHPPWAATPPQAAQLPAPMLHSNQYPATAAKGGTAAAAGGAAAAAGGTAAAGGGPAAAAGAAAAAAGGAAAAAGGMAAWPWRAHKDGALEQMGKKPEEEGEGSWRVRVRGWGAAGSEAPCQQAELQKDALQLSRDPASPSGEVWSGSRGSLSLRLPPALMAAAATATITTPTFNHTPNPDNCNVLVLGQHGSRQQLDAPGHGSRQQPRLPGPAWPNAPSAALKSALPTQGWPHQAPQQGLTEVPPGDAADMALSFPPANVRTHPRPPRSRTTLELRERLRRKEAKAVEASWKRSATCSMVEGRGGERTSFDIKREPHSPPLLNTGDFMQFLVLQFSNMVGDGGVSARLDAAGLLRRMQGWNGASASPGYGSEGHEVPLLLPPCSAEHGQS
ncbi:hypothetical protein QJQ45_007460 [Haematococcus lacustris]|nr:hypothetical protein QJQ45_007460 [Haematococcus lacustris]